MVVVHVHVHVHVHVINPRRMWHRVTVLGLVVCVSVSVSHAISYIPGLCVQSEAMYIFS